MKVVRSWPRWVVPDRRRSEPAPAEAAAEAAEFIESRLADASRGEITTRKDRAILRRALDLIKSPVGLSSKR